MIDCKHPPSRYYSGVYWNPVYGDTLWLGCCVCGEFLGERPPQEKNQDGYRHGYDYTKGGFKSMNKYIWVLLGLAVFILVLEVII